MVVSNSTAVYSDQIKGLQQLIVITLSHFHFIQ
jgi:hypothetical protein